MAEKSRFGDRHAVTLDGMGWASLLGLTVDLLGPCNAAVAN